MNEKALESFMIMCDEMLVPVEEGFIKNWKEKRKKKKEAKKKAKLAQGVKIITEEEENRDIKEILSKISSSTSLFKKAIINFQADPKSAFHKNPKFIEQLKYVNSISTKYLWIFDDINDVESDIRRDGYETICSLDLIDIYKDLKEKYGDELVIDVEDLSEMGWESVYLQFGEVEKFKTKYYSIDTGEDYKELSIYVNRLVDYKIEK